MFKFKSFLVSVCFLLLCSSALAASLTLDDETGQLIGATNVLVDSVYYDVLFIDGVMAVNFNQTQMYQTMFTTSEEAIAASQALLDQVFLDGDKGQFDSLPDTINGIENQEAGIFLTLYEFDRFLFYGDYAAYAFNSSYELEDRTGYMSVTNTTDTSSTQYMTFAVWNLSPEVSEPSPTPEPSTILLLGTGLLSLAGLSRKKHFNKA